MSTPITLAIIDSLDSFSLKDSLSAFAPVNPAFTDSIALSDALTIREDGFIDIEGDALALSDSNRVILALLETFSDSLDIEDNLDSVIAGINLSLSETIVLSDHLEVPATITLGINDTLTLSDHVDLLLPVTFVFSDTVTLSDQLDTFAPDSLAFVDSLFLSDNINLSGNGIPITFSIADSIALVDTVTYVVDCRESTVDSITLTDSLLVAGQDLLNLSDSLTFTDHLINPVARIEISIGLVFVGIGGSGNAPSSGGFVPNEGILFSDSVNATYGLHFGDISDEIIFSDSVSLSLIVIDPQVSDSFILSDSIQIHLDVTHLLVADSLILSDTVNVQIASNITRNVTDILNLSDAIDIAQFTDFIDYVRRYLNDVPCNSNVGS